MNDKDSVSPKQRLYLSKENVKIEELKESNIEHKEAFVERIMVQMLNLVIKAQSSGLCLDMV